MKKLNVLSAGVLAIAAGLALTSCGEKDSSKTIEFYTTAGDDLMVILNQAKAKYEEEHEGWEVKITNGFSYDTIRTKCTSALSANTQPSLSYCYPDHVASYLKTGKVLNLQDFIDNDDYGYSDEEWSDFISSYMTEGQSYTQEGTYSIPMARSTEVLYYNKTVLDKHNIEVPTTWDELWAACATLKAAYPKSTPLGYDSESNWVISYLEQYQALHNTGKLYTDATQSGDGKILFNSDITKNFLKDVKTQFDKGYLTTQTILSSYTSSLFTKYTATTESSAASYNGSFFSIGSTGGASKQAPSEGAFTAGVASIPGITKDSVKCISQGPSLVMFDQGSDERAIQTWNFVKVLLSTEIQASYSTTSGYNPIRNSVYELDAFKSALENQHELVKACILLAQDLGSANAFYTSDAFPGSSVARTQVGDALVNTLKITGTANIDSEISDILKEAFDETAYYTK